MNRCCCPARATGRLPGGGQGGGPQRDSGSPSFDVYFFFLESLLLPGTGGRSPARRGAGGERGLTPLHPPHPPTPRNPGTRKVSFSANSTPPAARRVGRRREPSRPFGAGDVRACSGAPSALRASGIAFAPAPRCIVGKMRGRPRLGRNCGQISGRGREQRRGEESNGQGTRPDSFFALPHAVRAFHL